MSASISGMSSAVRWSAQVMARPSGGRCSVEQHAAVHVAVEADSADVVGAGLVACLAHRHDGVRPPRLGVLLGAVRLRHLHGDLARARAQQSAVLVDDDGLDGRGAQVDAQQCHARMLDRRRSLQAATAHPGGTDHARSLPEDETAHDLLDVAAGVGLGRATQLGVDGDEVGLLARFERADDVVEAERPRAPERAQAQPLERSRQRRFVTGDRGACVVLRRSRGASA